MPAGGAQRIEVSDGKVVSHRAFTRSCLDLQTDPKAKGLVISHLMDPVPTEVHVFLSLSAHLPFFITTAPNGTGWVTEGGHITLVQRKPD